MKYFIFIFLLFPVTLLSKTISMKCDEGPTEGDKKTYYFKYSDPFIGKKKLEARSDFDLKWLDLALDFQRDLKKGSIENYKFEIIDDIAFVEWSVKINDYKYFDYNLNKEFTTSVLFVRRKHYDFIFGTTTAESYMAKLDGESLIKGLKGFDKEKPNRVKTTCEFYGAEGQGKK